MRFKPPAHLAVGRLHRTASHMVEPRGSDWEHDAVATVLIIGASGGVGLETVKAALDGGFGACSGAVSPKNSCCPPQARKNGRRRARDGHGEARADRSRCRHLVARRFGRARNHPQADAVFLQSDASARHRDGGGSSQAVDLRDGLRGRRQPQPRRVFVQRSVSSAAGARTMTTRTSGTHRPQEQARLGDRASRDPDR